MTEFKCFGCVQDESDTDLTECFTEVVSGRKVAGAIRSIVNAGGLQFECARVLHEALFMPALLYSSEMIWREEERPRNRGG